MGDVANILGLKAPTVSAEDTLRLVTEGKPKYVKTKVSKPAGMARELFLLVSDRDGSIAPSVQPSKHVAAPAYKTKRATAAKKKWNWTSFSNSARNDNKDFYHWQRADIQYSDYPYAKFNIKMEPVRYTDEEYTLCLTHSKWSRSETDYLMHVTHKFDMRWPVITDRYAFVPARRTEEIQERYLDVVMKLNNLRAPPGTANTVAEDSVRFALKHETERRRLQSSGEGVVDAEELAIMSDIKVVDASIQAVKKRKRENLAARKAELLAAGGEEGATVVEEDPQIALFTESEALEIAAGAAEDKEGRVAEQDAEEEETLSLPCLQSTRLRAPEVNSRLSNVLLQKMQLLLLELGVVSTDLLPTMAVCDLYDLLRRDIVALLSIKSELVKKNIELQSLKKTGGAAAATATAAAAAEGGDQIHIASSLFLKRKFPLPSTESLARATAAAAATAAPASGPSGSGAASSATAAGGTKTGTKGRGSKAARANAAAAAAASAAADGDGSVPSAESLELLKAQFKQKKNKRGTGTGKRKHSEVEGADGEVVHVKDEPVVSDAGTGAPTATATAAASSGQKKGKRMKSSN